jgi:hypothetical protein
MSKAKADNTADHALLFINSLGVVQISRHSRRTIPQYFPLVLQLPRRALLNLWRGLYRTI